MQITFDMPVIASSGLVNIFNQNDELFESISSAAFAINGAVASYQPSLSFEYNGFYFLHISGDAFHDGADNYLQSFWGWSFNTTTFLIVERNPASGESDTPVIPNLQISLTGS